MEQTEQRTDIKLDFINLMKQVTEQKDNIIALYVPQSEQENPQNPQNPQNPEKRETFFALAGDKEVLIPELVHAFNKNENFARIIVLSLLMYAKDHLKDPLIQQLLEGASILSDRKPREDHEYSEVFSLKCNIDEDGDVEGFEAQCNTDDKNLTHMFFLLFEKAPQMFGRMQNILSMYDNFKQNKKDDEQAKQD